MAKYALYNSPNPDSDKEKQTLHPRIVTQGTVSSKDIADYIARSSGFTAATTKGVLEALSEAISDHLQNGYIVDLGEIGSFSISLKSRPVKDKKEIRASSISFGRINFNASKNMKDRFKVLTLERDNEAGSTNYTSSQRKERALRLFSKDQYFTSTQYAAQNSCNRSTALRDLSELLSESKIKKIGHGKTVLYLLN